MKPGKYTDTASTGAGITPASTVVKGNVVDGNAAPAVFVCGTINIDTFVGLDEFPRRGETIIGRRGLQGLGGKGANQAVASARMGVETILLGAVGETSADNPNQPLDPLALLAIKDRKSTRL